jgi:hypothetical protein
MSEPEGPTATASTGTFTVDGPVDSNGTQQA